MPPKAELLSARNLIVLGAGVFILSLVATSLSALRPNDTGGWGRDTYGTRAEGFRAVFELLEALGIKVQRDLAPPRSTGPIDRTLVLLGPNSNLVQANPSYLQSLQAWVQRGGRLVVVLGNPLAETAEARSALRETPMIGPRDVLQALGLDGSFTRLDAPAMGPNKESWLSDWQPRVVAIPVRAVAGSEGMRAFIEGVNRLALPDGESAGLECKSPELRDALAITDKSGNERWIAASVRRGSGEIVVVSELAVFSNRYLAAADNSVLAARLFSPHGKAVVFDEFYHGLSVRGNPFYLLTRPGFAAVTVGILLALGVWTWRSAMFLGPPLARVDPPRRNIGEYVSAMAHFFRRGSDSGTFLLRETRDGVLREICHTLHLPPETPDAAIVVAALERRDPARAGRLRQALLDAEAALSDRRGVGSHQSLATIRRLTHCLSSNHTAQFAKSS